MIYLLSYINKICQLLTGCKLRALCWLRFWRFRRTRWLTGQWNTQKLFKAVSVGTIFKDWCRSTLDWHNISLQCGRYNLLQWNFLRYLEEISVLDIANSSKVLGYDGLVALYSSGGSVTAVGSSMGLTIFFTKHPQPAVHCWTSRLKFVQDEWRCIWLSCSHIRGLRSTVW